MGGQRLGSYDLLSTVAAGESTFLARRRPFTGEHDRLFAIRLVDPETAAWATDRVGRGWFPNLGPVVEVGRDRDNWFVVADVSDEHIDVFEANAERRSSRHKSVAVIAGMAVLVMGCSAWAWVSGSDDDPTDSAAEAEVERAPARAPIEPIVSAAPAASQPVAVKPGRQLSKRILRAQERQRQNRQPTADADRPTAVAKVKAAAPVAKPEPELAVESVIAKPAKKHHASKKPAVKDTPIELPAGVRICPRTGRVLVN